MPSNKSDGNIELLDISIGSTALTVKAVSAQKLGVLKLPGLDNITFSPDKKASLLRKNSTLLIFLSSEYVAIPLLVYVGSPTKEGAWLVASSPISLSAHVAASMWKQMAVQL